MRLLVAISNYGRKNDSYLRQVLASYRSMPYRTDIVVLSNIDKDLGKDVEVITGTPIKNPHSLPFGHKRVFGARRDAYDLFIYTEDDILITQHNIEAFLQATSILPPEQLAGFFRYEQHPNGTRYFPDVHSCYRWLPDSVNVIGGQAFARFTNDHSGCFALTRSQLARAIDSGGFLVPPHEGSLTLLETAATDPYTQCGFTKVICLPHFDDFLVHHLPNKYVGSALGLDASEFSRQIERLLDGHHDSPDSLSLAEPQTKVFRCRWSRNIYEPSRTDLIDMFPSSTATVLSIGCGWGATETELGKRRIKVTAVALDPMIGACAESRGVEVVYGDLENAIKQLHGRRFDGVLMSGILHLLQEPEKALRQASSLLSECGTLVATIPAFRRVPFLWERLRHPSRYRGLGDFRRSGVHPVGKRQAKSWFRDAGLSVQWISRCAVPARWRTVVESFGGLARILFASEYAIVGVRSGVIRPGTKPPGIVQSKAEPEMTCSADRKAGA